MAPKKVQTVDRTIHFYRIDLGLDAKGARTLFPTSQVLKFVDTLKFETGDRLLEAETDLHLALWNESSTKAHRAIFGYLRKSDFPELGDPKGKFSPLNVPRGSSIVDKVHMVFFKDNVLGAEFNFNGPRVTKLPFYIAEKAGANINGLIKISPLVRKDVKKEMKKLTEIKMLRFKVKASAISAIQEVNESLGDAFRAQADYLGANEFEIILRASRKQDSKLEKAAQLVRQLMARSDIMAGTKALQVKGYNTRFGRTDVVDLLSNQLIVKKSILKQNEKSRALDSEAAFNAILEAYSDMENEIINADSIEEVE